MMTNCQAIAFTLNRRYPKHLESSEHCRSEHKNIEDLRETFPRNAVAAQMEQTSQVSFGHSGREESAGELRRLGEQLLLKSQMMSC